MSQLYRVVAPHFVAGIVFDDEDRACLAAPILGWAVRGRWNRVKFLVRCNTNGWEAVWVSELFGPPRVGGYLTDCDMK